MALNDLGKVAVTFGGNYSASTVYERLTIVVASDGQTYGTIANNVSGVEPGVTSNWENYWQIVSMRGPKGVGIQQIQKTGTSGTTDTYTITYMDGSTWTYTVENGKGIQSIELTSTDENVDTYTITFGNNQTQTFTVTNARELAAGGTAMQVLTKQSGTDYDVAWQNIAEVQSVTLLASGWTGLQQTVAASAVKANSLVVIVAPAYASQWVYNVSGIGASAQGNGTITFMARTVPTVDLTVNVSVFG